MGSESSASTPGDGHGSPSQPTADVVQLADTSWSRTPDRWSHRIRTFHSGCWHQSRNVITVLIHRYDAQSAFIMKIDATRWFRYHSTVFFLLLQQSIAKHFNWKAGRENRCIHQSLDSESGSTGLHIPVAVVVWPDIKGK